MHEQFNPNTGNAPLLNVELLFDELRKDLPDDPNLPNDLQKVIKGPEDSQRIFNTALQYWQEVYSKEKVLKALSVIVANEKESADFFEAMQLLKRIRRPGNILLSVFLMLDNDHFAPEKHWRVIKNIGKVRDYAGTIHIQEYTDRLRSAIEDYSLKETEDSFQPDFQTGFERYISKTIDQMRNIVLTAQSDDVRALHILRKDGTRLLMNLFQMSCLANLHLDLNVNHFQMFAYFKMLDSKLGDVHDDAEVKRIQQAGNYDGVQMMVPEKLKIQILEAIDFLGREWQLNFDKSADNKPDPFSKDYDKYL
ncbi:MAG: hypothetical protein A2383_01325 [Candidatus Pacebacteria bacterium RIFOXYB1_FULL_39_46]|nr:MAG: hypothetical protein A2383_01325 [Candidatus Pacebacteria bacterium RIFOXYB1_FULL_39_46]OGJ39033.1 MAG: hypothetical protein A2182_01745 [Candidatus Pacebacteria bacterium RIFOXYA1_FULL_38_18]OGJ40004.1 MAG: hypothetical protein A2582_01270 [Candidatus Pacebacteria bacterium RIFOXYD1_FULL_39_27]OGJ40734.1 MAG: hypothetical protein A2411_00425 [Candidatus Pacebacteria bacterium RIFOXYC1_FULL_39_21]